MNLWDLRDKKVYDISILLGGEQIEIPLPTEGVNRFSRIEAFRIEDGGPFLLSNLLLNCHTGTHVDVPLHFIPNEKPIDEYSVQHFILPSVVIDIANGESIQPSELKDVKINEGDALLFKTNNSKKGLVRKGIMSDQWVYMSSEAADFCIERKVRLVGIDYVAPEKPPLGEDIIHKKLFRHNILIMENIALDQVPPGNYTLICLPLKIKGAEASPVRAVLIS